MYVPGPTFGGVLSPSLKTAFGASVGFRILMSQTNRLTPAFGSSGLSFSFCSSSRLACSVRSSAFGGFSLERVRITVSPSRNSSVTLSFSEGFSRSQ